MATKCAADTSPTRSPTATTSPAAIAHEQNKRTLPLFIPRGATTKKPRVGLVRRTHSPKNVPSPLSSPVINRKGKPIGTFDVHRVAPTVQGVAEGARMLSGGNILSVPTETTYYYCASIDLNRKQSEDSGQERTTLTNDSKETDSTVSPLSCLFENISPRPKVLLRSPSEVDRIIALMPKAYAIQSSGTKVPPVSFHEGREVFRRLASRYWPGPLPVYLSCCKSGLSNTTCHGTDYEKVKLGLEYLHPMPAASNSAGSECFFVGMRCPSHPLTCRILNDVHEQSKDRNTVVVALPASVNEQHLTSAQDVCQHLITLPAPPDRKMLYVLNGEDKREAFVVPTCQYGQPCHVGLWIHTRIRTVYIIGTPDPSVRDLTTQHVQHALLHSTNRDLKRQNRKRVITAVLQQWKVVDCRK